MTTAINTDDAALLNEYPDELNDDSFAALMAGDEPDEGEDAPAPKRKPSEKKAPAEDRETPDADEDTDETSEETPEDKAGDDEGEGAEENEEGEDEAKSKKFADDSDETYVKVKVGDEVHEVKVNDLKRLFGQEASLTRKSQEVAQERTAIDQKRAENIAAYDVLLKRATERADKYRALPWTQLLKDPTVPAEQLQALQAEANEVFQDEQFLKAELGNFMQKVAADQQAAMKEQAQACYKSITTEDSPNYIKGWSDELYGDIRKFGNEMGFNTAEMNALTNPAAFKVLHMAMQFKRGASKVVTKKVNKTPTKIVKNSASAPATRGSSKQTTAKSAVSKAARTGSMEDAASAFEALFD
jgi:hypothetical protein